MVEPSESRVAVYIDFDNIVISRYDEVFGRESFKKDKARSIGAPKDGAPVEPGSPAGRAVVDVGAILDYATSFGSVVISRAFADWSAPANSKYSRQLVDRAVDLTQMFPTAAYQKNGADIRLSVDVVEDMFRLPEITHVVIVAGDSDFIPLAQRCKRLGRYVIGIGVKGATSPQLAAACNEFKFYGDLPGVVAEPEKPKEKAPPVVEEPPVAVKSPRRRASKPQEAAETEAPDPDVAATQLLVKAMVLRHGQSDDDWLSIGPVKNQMMRIEPAFTEKTLGFKSFSDFLKSRGSLVELDASTTPARIRLRETATPAA